MKGSSAISTREPQLTSTGNKVTLFVQEVKVNPRRPLFSEKDETSTSVIKEPEATVPISGVILEQTTRSIRNPRRMTMYALSTNTPVEEKPVEVPNTSISAKKTAELLNGRKRLGTPLLDNVMIKRPMHTLPNKHEDKPAALLNNEQTKNRRRTLFTPNKVIEYRGNKSHIENAPPNGKLFKIIHAPYLTLSICSFKVLYRREPTAQILLLTAFLKCSTLVQ